MKKTTDRHFLFLLLFIVFSKLSLSQKKAEVNTDGKTITVSAGPEYKMSSFGQWLWGKNYRKDWITPVRVPYIWLKDEKGGLVAYKSGGGHQTKSLHLRSKDDKEYALRSVDKTLGAVLPKDFKNTFIEVFVDDKVSMSNPYAAVTVPILSENAKVYHTNPSFVFLPKQKELDTFNHKFANNLYLFEQRLDGSWKEADNLGNFNKYINTDKLLDKIYDDNDVQVDQQQFVRSRLFDMFIGDWDRHEDQWRWGAKEDGDKKVYVPIPQDRDQAYFKFNGVLLKLLIGASGMKYFQSFANKLPDVKTFNYEERDLDRFFANKTTLNDWQTIAQDLQKALTNDVIEKAIKQLPPEIYPIDGHEIIKKLESRREHLVEEATTYYLFLAKEVDIVGSKKRDYFNVRRQNDDETVVDIYKINKEGEKKKDPFYTRVFKTSETKEIRLYGLAGKDVYNIDGNANGAIKLRIIGGVDKDSVINNSHSAGKVQVYDDADNYFAKNGRTRLHLSDDSAIHAFNYRSYLYDKKGIKPSFFYGADERFYVGLGYGWLHNKWRKLPFASKQSIEARYSLSQKAIGALYAGLFPQFVGKWDLALNGAYDAIRWTNFFGLGNETKFTKINNIKDINYYRVRSEEWTASAAFIRTFGASTFNITGFYQNVRIIADPNRFLTKTFNPVHDNFYDAKDFAGAKIIYSVFAVNDSVVPTKGIAFGASAAYTQNLLKTNRSTSDYASNVQFYIPLVSKFSLALKAGAETVAGDPEFYQYAAIGGGQIMRGFRLTRFWGKTAFYNSDEIRYISNVKSYLYNGKAGFLAFIDNGRVWMPNEKSDTWHYGYGGGIVLAPFNKTYVEITYGVSADENLIQFRFIKPFK